MTVLTLKHMRTLAVNVMVSHLILVRACSFHGDDSDFHHLRHLSASNNNADTTSFETDSHHHEKHLWQHHHHDYFFPPNAISGSGNESNSASGQPERSDIHMRSLYPGPYIHTALPTDFSLCGTPSPSLRERIQLGKVFADYERDAQQGSLGPEGSSESRKLITIPVWFHVFQQTATIGKLKKSQVKEGLMPVLNKAFENANVTFALQGVRKHISAKWFACDDFAKAKERTRKGGVETLNVFVCNLAGKGLGGAAFLPPIVDGSPELDGVHLANPALGLADFIPQALVHEVGHWMGLLHTFEDGCTTKRRYHLEKYPDYFFVGDGIRDTAAHDTPTWDSQPKNYCYQGDGLDTCNKLEGMDPIDNYMNYLPTECFADYGRFTEDQNRRMRAQYRKWRKPEKTAVPTTMPTFAPTTHTPITDNSNSTANNAS